MNNNFVNCLNHIQSFMTDTACYIKRNTNTDGHMDVKRLFICKGCYKNI